MVKSEESTPREARRFWQDPYLVALLVVHGLMGFLYVLYVLPGSPLSPITLVYEDKGLIAMVALAILAPWAGLPRIQDKRERLFWLSWTISLGAILLIRLLYLVDPELELHDPGALTQDVLYLTFYLFMILSLLLQPDRRAREAGGWPVHPLELAGTGVFVLVLLVYFIGVPHFLTPWDYDTWIPSMVLYWTLDCFILANLVYLRQTSRDEGWRILYTWLALAVFCWVLTDFSEILYWAGIAEIESYGILDYLWYAPWLLIGLAGRLRVAPAPPALARGGGGSRLPEQVERSRAGWLPVAALALPIIHFGADLAGFLDPDTRVIREAIVLISLLALLILAYLHQRALENRATVLAWEKEEAEARRELLATVVEQAPDIILIASAEARVWYANSALSSAGQVPSEVLGYPLDQVLAHAEPGPGRGPLHEALRTGTTWEGRGQIPASGGMLRDELITVSPVRNKAGEVTNFVSVRRDITHRARLERHAQQSQRIKALGKLSEGIAHHFNNDLTAIRGHAEALAASFDVEAPERDEIRGILDAVRKASSLVDRILIFSQGVEEEKKLVNVPEVVHETVSLLRPSLPGGTNIVEQIQGDSGSIWADRRQIHEAISNLCTHRIRAMAEGGGELHIWVDKVSIGKQRAEALGLDIPGDYVHVAVRDSAPGLSEGDVEQVFDPFYLDHDLTEDADLSLPVVHGAVTSSGGVIIVESQGKMGTLFQLYFPAAEEDR